MRHKLFTGLTVALLLATIYSFSLDRVYPDKGPTFGETKINFYSDDLQSVNRTIYKRATCKFDNKVVKPATWVHCIGNRGDKEHLQWCLSCMSPASDNEGTIDLEIDVSDYPAKPAKT